MDTNLVRVLVAEDDPDVRLAQSLALQRFGQLEVEFCEDGNQVVDKSRAWHPQLILLDVLMPGLDGPGTLLALQHEAELARLPVVFVTARTEAEEQRRLLALGAVAVIEKPFELRSLAGRLRDIWQTLPASARQP